MLRFQLRPPAPEHHVVLDPFKLYRHFAAQRTFVAQGPQFAAFAAGIEGGAAAHHQRGIQAIVRVETSQPCAVDALVHAGYYLAVEEEPGGKRVEVASRLPVEVVWHGGEGLLGGVHGAGG